MSPSSSRGAAGRGRDLAVVTGASRGIGFATSLAFARRGLDVAMLGRSGARLQAAAGEVRALGGEARAFACDVGLPDDVEGAAASVLSLMGVPRVVVNNAGIVRRGPRVHETTPADWDEVVRINLRGPFLVARAFLPAMIAAKRGRFVQIASISATLGSPGAASYAASKWGLIGLTKSLADELRGTGVTAIAVLPGSVDTDMLAGSGFAPVMTADDVARTLMFVSLDAPDAMNGSAVEMFG